MMYGIQHQLLCLDLELVVCFDLRYSSSLSNIYMAVYISRIFVSAINSFQFPKDGPTLPLRNSLLYDAQHLINNSLLGVHSVFMYVNQR